LGVAPFTLAVPIENCGNVALSGSPLVAGPSELGLTAPVSFNLGPRATGTLDVLATPQASALDSILEINLRLDTTEGITASRSYTILHTTGIVLERTSASTQFESKPGLNVFRVEVRNTGGAGGLLAPTVEGLPPGWSASVLPPRQTVAAGATSEFSIVVDTGSAAPGDRANLALSFFPGSPRAGEFVLPVTVTVSGATTGPGTSSPSAIFPVDWTPALALAAGFAVTAAAAAVARSSRGVPRVCPACGHKAPVFDIYLDPTCTHCGARLAQGIAPTR